MLKVLKDECNKYSSYKEHKLNEMFREISDSVWENSRAFVSRIDDKNEMAKLIYYLAMGYPKETLCCRSDGKVYINIDKLDSEDRVRLLIGGIY